MDYLGKRVKRDPGGRAGTVRSYDSSRGVFKIEYDGGDFEELEALKVAGLLLDDSVSGNGFNSFRSGSSVGLDLNADADVGLDLDCVGNGGLDLNADISSNGIIDLNMDAYDVDSEVVREEGGLNERKGYCFDLNLELGEEMKEGCEVPGCDPPETDEGGCGDGYVEVVVEKAEEMNCGQAINLVIECTPVELEMNDSFSNGLGFISDVPSCSFSNGLGFNSDVPSCSPKWTRGRKKKLHLETNINSEAETKFTESDPVQIELKNSMSDPASADAAAGSMPKKRRGRKRKVPLDTDTTFVVKTEFSERNSVEFEGKTLSFNDVPATGSVSNTATVSASSTRGRRGRKRKVQLEADTDSAVKTEFSEKNPVKNELKNSSFNDGSASGLKSIADTLSVESPGRRRGRKRKASSNADTVAAPDTVLRRSARRARNSTLYSEDNVSHTVVSSDNVKEMSSSPSASAGAVSEIVAQEGVKEQIVLPPKVELPPSSGNLNLGDMPVIDVFSVYSFLRSFSSLLFLSPFELEDFVSSLNGNASSSLIDSIHVSLLKTLRKHLESVPDESSQSASECLRCHNWDLLDMITWPIFMVDYLLTYSSGLKPGFDLCNLKLLESDYYEQCPSIKIEILRCLCDDVIEVDCVKSEINKRSLVTEANSADSDWSMKLDHGKRRKDVMDITGSCVTDDNTDETVDWNSDECCLCKLDGNLICCDGCPAAFHSRCVGVISNHLPEGDWYCPECMIDKDKSVMSLGKAMRGAEVLGTDAYGQMYYSCCGYLLVLPNFQDTASSKYYLRDDLPAVVEVLKSSISLNYTIMHAVVKQWDLLSEVVGEKKYYGLREGALIQRSEHSAVCPKVGEAVADDASLVSATKGGEFSKLGFGKVDTGDHAINQGDLILSSEGSVDGSLAVILSTRSRVSDRIGSRRKVSALSKPTERKNADLEKSGPDLYTINAKNMSPANCYVNYYSLAQTASAISDHFSRKLLTKESENALKSLDDILLEQMKAISDNFMEFCWPNMMNSQVDASKENCGWCFPCKVPEVERECLISLYSCIPSLENFSSEALGICFKISKESHLVDVMCHICCIEERLQGLLLGPWLNPQYSKFWRKSLLGATGIASVKNLLLKIESNLRPIALSADWTKHVDSAVAIGSGVHIVTSSTRGPSRSVLRKRARCPEPEAFTTSNTASGLGLLWWRGSRLSRRLFNWKVVPRELASKAARQGGCRKIPGILYSDGSEFAKRSRFVAWKAGVESSKSVEQLALHVREFDANIRWGEIENNIVSLKLEKESKKPVKSFKKVIVRKKCIEGALVKYLLDFGKRRFIPDVVLKFGSKIEESSGDRKKFWLEESHLPLHLLKSFEQKRLARKTNQPNSGKLPENISVVNQFTKRKGFSYLFTKAERSENYQCGHCNKDVLMREAVCCQYCKGFFHKRHVRKSAGSITAQITYTCHKCQANKYFGVNSRLKNFESRKIKKASKDSKQLRSLLSKPRNLVGGTMAVQGNKQSRKNQKKKKVTVVVPLRRSTRKTRPVLLQNKKTRAHKRGKRRKSNNGASKKPLNIPWQKKRSQCHPIFWLNGLHLSRKPNDERVLQFKRNNLLVLSGNSAGDGQQPKCSLCCELEFSPKLIYIGCELCGDWFHGDALDLKREQIDMLVGFKCHVCLGRSPPCCPHLGAVKVEATKLAGLSDHDKLDVIPDDTCARQHHTLKIDDVEQLACTSAEKAESLEGVCSPCNRHGQQSCELMASDDGYSLQKEGSSSLG